MTWNDDMASAPHVEGKRVELIVRHMNADFSANPIKEGWVAKVEARWTDFNNGGWVWMGLCGTPTHWRLPAEQEPQKQP